MESVLDISQYAVLRIGKSESISKDDIDAAGRMDRISKKRLKDISDFLRLKSQVYLIKSEPGVGIAHLIKECFPAYLNSFYFSINTIDNLYLHELTAWIKKNNISDEFICIDVDKANDEHINTLLKYLITGLGFKKTILLKTEQLD